MVVWLKFFRVVRFRVFCYAVAKLFFNACVWRSMRDFTNLPEYKLGFVLVQRLDLIFRVYIEYFYDRLLFSN